MTKNLYDPSFEHDACGVGMVADLTGRATNDTVRDALTILETLEHRGATGSDVESGDGAGILTQLPDSFIREVFDQVPPPGHYGIAQWMVPPESDLPQLRYEIDIDLARVGLASRAWRDVPVDSSLLGPTSRAGEPLFFQQLIVRTDDSSDSAPAR
jgi:glutamate synthase (NADPH/NADH) large chain